jgi:DNA-binding transcriptional LysR family regulator
MPMIEIEDVDLNLFRVFQAVLRDRSLTRAGERLKLSQPAVSYSLGRLRAIFNDPLFVRGRSGMEPTVRALALQPVVDQALDAVREALRTTVEFDAATSSRTFRILVSDAGEMDYIPRIWGRMMAEAPRLKLSVVPMSVDLVEDALRTNRLDCAIGNLPSLMSSTSHQVLFEETYVCLTRKRAGLPRSKALSVQQFSAGGHVRVRSIEHSHFNLDETLRSKGIGREVVLELAHFAALPGVLSMSDLYVVLPRRLALAFNRNEEFQMFETPARLGTAPVTMHWHEFYDREPGSMWFRGLVAEVIQELLPT